MDKYDLIFTILISVIVIGGIGIWVFVKYSSIDSFCDVVEEKWIKYHGEDAKYLISTGENGVLENTDEILVWKWDSSDFYANIEVGEHYCFKTIGWRIPFFSWYKNIIELNVDNEKRGGL